MVALRMINATQMRYSGYVKWNVKRLLSSRIRKMFGVSAIMVNNVVHVRGTQTMFTQQSCNLPSLR
jgi:hypothetical protein